MSSQSEEAKRSDSSEIDESEEIRTGILETRIPVYFCIRYKACDSVSGLEEIRILRLFLVRPHAPDPDLGKAKWKTKIVLILPSKVKKNLFLESFPNMSI